MTQLQMRSRIELSDIAMIGDQRSCALLDKSGNIIWYCPRRFDHPSLFASLLDSEKGGSWSLQLEDASFSHRRYIKDSGILETHLSLDKGGVVVTDWMPLNARFYGICRQLTSSPVSYTTRIEPKPDYNRTAIVLHQKSDGHVTINHDYHLYSSHQLDVDHTSIFCEVPEQEEAWFIFSEKALDRPAEYLQESKAFTLEHWAKMAAHIDYHGPYEEEVRKSLRMIRLLTFAQNGGIIAAATTSLPEVTGGERNYDYRYVWLRDAAMIVSALARAGSDGVEERKFLDFICSAMHRISKPVVPMLTLDEQPAGKENELDFSGYKESRPVVYGNNASNQLQLDANSNVLIAAKVIYNRYDTLEHWETVRDLADFLVDHWNEPDHGIWEEASKHQYTSSKVITSISLQYLANHSKDDAEKQRWLDTSKAIRSYVEEHCVTKNGAYAVHAGSDEADVSAVLFPLWGYCEPDTDIMQKTVARLEKEYCRNHLYRRHLVEYDSQKEGGFLAGTFWMAQYYVMLKDWNKVESIFDAAFHFMNDVGIMPEEGDPQTGEWLGNIPQSFVHASLIGAVIDYKNKRYGNHEASSA